MDGAEAEVPKNMSSNKENPRDLDAEGVIVPRELDRKIAGSAENCAESKHAILGQDRNYWH